MRLLLDAHALIWWMGMDERLSRSARDEIATAEPGLLGSGTLAELAIKRSIGKTGARKDWATEAQGDGFGFLPFDWRHAERLEALPFPTVNGREHRDPFDRMLVAQALVEGIPIVTRDPAMGAYGCGVIW